MITNGFDITQVQSALLTRIGWQQPTVSGSMTISVDNRQSDSGRYFQQFHPMLTPANLLAAQEDEVITSNNFNTFLSDLKKGCINSVLNAVYNRPQIIESTLIFDRLRRNDIPTQKAGMFCGYRLWIAPGPYAVQVSQVSFLFSGDASFNLYLFHDAVKLPIYTLAVNVTGNSETIVTLPNWVLKYIDSTNKNQGGVFFLGYFQDDLPAQVVALDEFVSLWNTSYTFGYTAFEATRSAPNPNADFTRIGVPYTYKTYGMNLELQGYRDYTNWIMKNASLFDEAIGLAMAVVALGYMSYSTRSNFVARATKEMAQNIYNEINGSGSYVTTPYIAGLKKQIEREISRIQDNAFHDPSKSNEFSTTRPFEYAMDNNPMVRV